MNLRHLLTLTKRVHHYQCFRATDAIGPLIGPRWPDNCPVEMEQTLGDDPRSLVYETSMLPLTPCLQNKWLGMRDLHPLPLGYQPSAHLYVLIPNRFCAVR